MNQATSYFDVLEFKDVEDKHIYDWTILNLRLDDLRMNLLNYDLRFFILFVNRQSHNSIVDRKSSNRKSGHSEIVNRPIVN
jgi:hypothetical protein